MTVSVPALNLLFAVISDAAYALIVGCLLATYWLRAATAGTLPVLLSFLHRICLICVAGLILGQTVRPWFAAASMSGSDAFAANLALVPAILFSTHSGKVWFVGTLALVVLLVAVLAGGRQIKAAAVGPLAASLVLFGCAKAASGHAAGEGDFTLAELSMLLHIAGTAVWAGTVVASGLIVVPYLVKLGDRPALWSYVTLLSKTVTWALPVILLCGIYNSYRELDGSLHALWSSGWGRILISKVAFVSLALALGATTRFQCVRRPATSERTDMLVRLMRGEALVMIVILCLSGLLANSPPAMESHAERQLTVGGTL